MYDKTSSRCYLIDTGADVSVLPKPLANIPKPTGFKLAAANNSVIHTYGRKILTLDLGLRRNFEWKFFIADVRKPIIGADFLSHYGCL